MKKQVVVALFATVFLFAMTFVSANQYVDFMNNFSTILPDMLVAKWLFFFLILIIVLGISEVLPFFEKKGVLSTLFSIIVAFLAVYFLDSEAVYTALISYNALGVTLTAIAPFLLLVFVAYKCYSKNEPRSILLAKVLWIFYIVTITWLSFSHYFNPTEVRPASSLYFIYPLVLLLSLIMLFIEGSIHRWWYSNALKRAASSSNFQSKVQRDAYLKIVKLLKEKQEVIDDTTAVAIIDGQIAQIKKNAGL